MSSTIDDRKHYYNIGHNKPVYLIFVSYVWK